MVPPTRPIQSTDREGAEVGQPVIVCRVFLLLFSLIHAIVKMFLEFSTTGTQLNVKEIILILPVINSNSLNEKIDQKSAG